MLQKRLSNKTKMPEQESILCGAPGRLDSFVAAETELSRTQAQRLIREGDILLNGKRRHRAAVACHVPHLARGQPELEQQAQRKRGGERERQRQGR